jgi:hypothetical protein
MLAETPALCSLCGAVAGFSQQTGECPMIIASVRFPLPEGTSLEEARKLYEQNLATYENAPGLITKYYVFGGGKGGGIYLWESREAAERFYTPEWREMIAKKYKGAGEIEWLENPVTVDNRGRKAKAA